MASNFNCRALYPFGHAGRRARTKAHYHILSILGDLQEPFQPWQTKKWSGRWRLEGPPSLGFEKRTSPKSNKLIPLPVKQTMLACQPQQMSQFPLILLLHLADVAPWWILLILLTAISIIDRRFIDLLQSISLEVLCYRLLVRSNLFLIGSAIVFSLQWLQFQYFGGPMNSSKEYEPKTKKKTLRDCHTPFV